MSYCKLWIKDAPKYGINSNYDIQSFVDKFITCEKILLLETFHGSQHHRHKQIFQKKKPTNM
jgi:hypothetical protein